MQKRHCQQYLRVCCCFRWPDCESSFVLILNSLHSARNLMFKERLSPYSIMSRKSTSSVPVSAKGRNVSTLGVISSSSSSAVTELISSSRRLNLSECKVIPSSAATMWPSLLGFPSAGNPSIPSGNDCAVLLVFRIGLTGSWLPSKGNDWDGLLPGGKWVPPSVESVAASVTSLLVLPNVFVGTLTLVECVGSSTCTSKWCVRLFCFASCTSDGCLGKKSVGFKPKIDGEVPD